LNYEYSPKLLAIANTTHDSVSFTDTNHGDEEYFDSSREPGDRLAAVLADLGDARRAAEAAHTPVK